MRLRRRPHCDLSVESPCWLMWDPTQYIGDYHRILHELGIPTGQYDSPMPTGFFLFTWEGWDEAPQPMILVLTVLLG